MSCFCGNADWLLIIILIKNGILARRNKDPISAIYVEPAVLTRLKQITCDESDSKSTTRRSSMILQKWKLPTKCLICLYNKKPIVVTRKWWKSAITNFCQLNKSKSIESRKRELRPLFLHGRVKVLSQSCNYIFQEENESSMGLPEMRRHIVQHHAEIVKSLKNKAKLEIRWVVLYPNTGFENSLTKVLPLVKSRPTDWKIVYVVFHRTPAHLL